MTTSATNNQTHLEVNTFLWIALSNKASIYPPPYLEALNCRPLITSPLLTAKLLTYKVLIFKVLTKLMSFKRCDRKSPSPKLTNSSVHLHQKKCNKQLHTYQSVSTCHLKNALLHHKVYENLCAITVQWAGWHQIPSTSLTNFHFSTALSPTTALLCHKTIPGVDRVCGLFYTLKTTQKYASKRVAAIRSPSTCKEPIGNEQSEFMDRERLLKTYRIETAVCLEFLLEFSERADL